MSIELKPCPFCGGKPDVMISCGKAWVHCSDNECPALPQTKYLGHDEAITAWNTRVSVPEQPDELWFIETVDQAIRRYHPQITHKRAYSGDIARELLSALRPYLNPTMRESSALNEIAECLCDALQNPSNYHDAIVYAKQVAETALSKIEDGGSNG
jgi:hypothetical protein